MAPQDTLIRPLTKADFLTFLVGEPEERHEFVNGQIIRMPGGTADHTGVGTAFVMAIGKQIDEDRGRVFCPDRGVETAETVRYPDVIVDTLPIKSKSRWTTTPALIVEVLSPNSGTRDLVTKAAEYTGMATLQAYIVAMPDMAQCQVWIRDEQSDVFAPEPVEVAGAAGVIDIPAISLTIRLAEIYRHVLPRT